jgi:hypothetical protein
MASNAGAEHVVWEKLIGTNHVIGARGPAIEDRGGAITRDTEYVSPVNEDATSPHVSLGANASTISPSAIYVWRSGASGGLIESRSRGGDSVLGPIQVLSGGGASDPQVAGNGNGDIAYVWERFNGANTVIEARIRTGGDLLPANRISPAGENASDPQVAIDDSGNATFAWSVATPGGKIVQTRRRLASGGLEAAPVDLSTPGADAVDPRLTLNNGDATFVWRWNNGSNFVVQTRRRDLATGTLNATQDLSATGTSASDPRVATLADGDAVVAWVDGATARVQMRVRDAATGTLGPVAFVSPSGGAPASQPNLLANGTNAVFLWVRSDGSNDRIQRRNYDASTGTFDTAQNLSPAGASATSPLATGASAQPFLAWARAGVIQLKAPGTHTGPPLDIGF